jgi:hypothetical protein
LLALIQAVKNLHDGLKLKKDNQNYALWRRSSDTDSLFLPLALLEANTRLPFALLIRSLNPCLFLLFLWEGWNVLFMTL